MFTYIDQQENIAPKSSTIFLSKDIDAIDKTNFSVSERDYMSFQHKENEKSSFVFNHLTHVFFQEIVEVKENKNHNLEHIRKIGDKCQAQIQQHKLSEVFVYAPDFNLEEMTAFAEALVLSNYSFIAYKTDKEKNSRSLSTIHLVHQDLSSEITEELNILMEATLTARSLVNQPVNYLNAQDLAHEIEKLGKDSNAKVEILNKTKIEALKMGGLLAVNQGSPLPPTFTVFEYKPTNAINKKPLVLVGKGVVYDTGGLNIKTGDFMNDMKGDMGGAAAVAGAAFAIAKAALPLHIVALIPATDNRPGQNAYASGDVITMFDGQTVEVINTDAEGRMILADALAYAKKYDPMLVIDMATLTGSAARAIGNLGIVAMGSKYANYMDMLKESGEKTSERIVEFLGYCRPRFREQKAKLPWRWWHRRWCAIDF